MLFNHISRSRSKPLLDGKPYYQEPWEGFIDRLKSEYGASAISMVLPGLRTKALNQPSAASLIHAGQSHLSPQQNLTNLDINSGLDSRWISSTWRWGSWGSGNREWLMFSLLTGTRVWVSQPLFLLTYTTPCCLHSLDGKLTIYCGSIPNQKSRQRVYRYLLSFNLLGFRLILASF